MRHGWPTWALLLAIATTVEAARAEAPPPPAGDASTRAEALFQEGKKLLDEGRLDAACGLLAQSDQLDPTVAAHGLLAACHEQRGLLLAAWREFRETARRAEAARDERGEFAKKRAAALEARLPRIAIRVARAAPGLQIQRDGALVPTAELGAEIPVDPGAHEITIGVPGQAAQRIRVIAREGAVVTVDVPDLSQPPCPAPPPPETVAQRLGARLPAGLAVGAFGLVAAGVGAGFALSAIRSDVDSKRIGATCRGAACDAGREAREAAYRAATVSTVAFGVAVAGIGAGAALLLWPRGRAPAHDGGSLGKPTAGLRIIPVFDAQGGGAVVGGVF